VSNGPADQPRNVMDLEPLHHIFPVSLDRLHAQAEPLCDLFRRASLGDELQNVALARRQALQLAWGVFPGCTAQVGTAI